jgi:small nuclear ribonucleoprotein (snRNP)-like protein
MKRTPTTLFLALAIFVSSFGPVARAQSTLNTETKAKTEVTDRLNKKETRVKVKLRNGSEMKGRITQSGENSFTLTDEKTGNRSDIAYTDVVNVEGRGMSKKKKTFIAIGVGAAIFAGMVAYAFTHIWDD